MTLRFLAILALLLVNAFCVAAEFAIARSRRNRLEAMSRLGDRLARLALRATSNLRRMLSASQLGITVSSIALGWVVASLFADLLMPLADRWDAPGATLRLALAAAAALLVVGYVHVVFAELVPRAAAMAHPERAARLLAPPMLAFAWVTAPILAAIEGTAAAFRRRLGAPEDDDAGHTPEELRLLVEESHERGDLERRDAALLEGVFEFSEKTAREVMTPRIEIVALPIGATLDETMAIVEESQSSRYPVYEDTIDHIVGVVLAKDLLGVLRRPPPSFSLASIMRGVHLVPGTREVEEVLADFKRLKEHMAIVLDEYGGTAGLVTMEDLLEEIVGEIFDEFDEPEEEPTSGRAGEVVVAGQTHIGELNERFGLDVPDESYATIGGFVFGALGRLPVTGDRVTAGGAVFTVRQMEGRRIEALSVDLHSAGDRRGATREAGD